MQLRHAQLMFIAAWILAVGVIGVIADVTSMAPAILLVGFGVAPPALMLQLWNGPQQTLSESIQEARQ